MIGLASARLLPTLYRCLGGFALLLLFTGLPAEAQLDGVSEVGHSFQSDARGGCEVAIGDTGLAHVRQPASVLLQARAKFDSKITNIFVRNHWSATSDGAFSTIKQLLSYNLGATVPLGERNGLGLAWETGGWSTRFKNRFVQYPGSAETSVDLKKYSIYANFGRKLTERWYVGVGPHLQVVKFTTGIVLGNGMLKWPNSYSVGAGFQLGSIYNLTKKVRLGASYVSPTFMGAMTNRNARFLIPGYGELSGPLTIKPFIMPGRISFGVSCQPTERMKLATEAGYLNYRNSLYGNVRLAGIFNTKFDAGFKDIWVINSGLDYDFNRNWSGSVGYVWNSAPISRKQMIPIYASNTQNMFTWGLRYKRGRWWTGFAHIIGLPALTRSTPVTHLALGTDYQNSAVRQMLQSFNCGVGFYF